MEPFNVEFGPAKSVANRLKIRSDFVEAQALWDDDRMIECGASGREQSRSIAVGVVRERCWAETFTIRSVAIRLISVRRARTRGVELYEGQ